MNRRSVQRAAVSPWLVILAVLTVLLGTATTATTVLAQSSQLNHSTCSGSHCTVVGLWKSVFILRTIAFLGLPATLNMDTIAGQPKAAPTCAAGSTFEIPITATGELAGMAMAYFDSPPITFQDAGTLEADTTGILQRSCSAFNPVFCTNDSWEDLLINAFGAAQAAQMIPVIQQQFETPLTGVWDDRWSTTSPAITCQTSGATTATCTLANTVAGPVTLTLRRSVRDMVWRREQQGSGGELEGGGNPWPATMTSSVTINCPQPPPQPSISPTPSVSPPPPVFPNLTLTNINHDPVSPLAGETVDIAAQAVSNGSTATTQATAARARVDLGADSTWNQILSPVSIPALARTATHNLAWPEVGPLPAGTHRYEICVDPDNLVAETNEADNCQTRTIVMSAPPQYPDLVTSGITVTPTITLGQTGSITALIRNIGAANAAASTASLTLNGAPVTTLATNALVSGGSHPYTFTWTPTQAGANLRLELCADSTGAVTEANEDNNCAFTTVTVTNPAIPTPTPTLLPTLPPTPPPTPVIPTPTITPPPPTTEPFTTPSPQPGPIRETE